MTWWTGFSIFPTAASNKIEPGHIELMGKRKLVFFILIVCMCWSQQIAGNEVTAPQIPAFDNPTADLPAMKSRHMIRVLVNFNKMDFFLTGGKPCGYEYELLQEYARRINKGLGRREKRTELVFIPVPFKRLIPALLKGKGRT